MWSGGVGHHSITLVARPRWIRTMPLHALRRSRQELASWRQSLSANSRRNNMLTLNSMHMRVAARLL